MTDANIFTMLASKKYLPIDAAMITIAVVIYLIIYT